MGDLADDSMNGVNNFETGPMDCGKKVSKCVDFVVLYRYIGYKIGQISYLLCIKFDFILNLKDLLEKKYIWLGQHGLAAEHLFFELRNIYPNFEFFFYKKFDVVFETAVISKLALFRIIKIRSHSKPIVYLWNVIWGKTKCTSRSDRSLKWYYHNVASNKKISILHNNQTNYNNNDNWFARKLWPATVIDTNKWMITITMLKVNESNKGKCM